MNANPPVLGVAKGTVLGLDRWIENTVAGLRGEWDGFQALNGAFPPQFSSRFERRKAFEARLPQAFMGDRSEVLDRMEAAYQRQEEEVAERATKLARWLVGGAR